MAADNDLLEFSDRNLKQLQAIGSNEFISLVVLLATPATKQHPKELKMLLIEHENSTVLKQTTASESIDMGDAQTLISFCTEAIKEFPADKYALIFWDHGTGPLNPFYSFRIATSDLFSLDYQAMESENDFFNYFDLLLEKKEKKQTKAVCFDDTTGNFLTEEKILFALSTVSKKSLHGGKFSLIGFDACLMATIEVASGIKEYADIMVASQDVELGAGWNYKKAFSPFLTGDITPTEWGAHIVTAYSKTYNFINDYTLSCIDLRKLAALEADMLIFTKLLHQNLTTHNKHAFIKTLQMSREKHLCTHFNEPDYIDLEHFYKNFLKNSSSIELTTRQETAFFKETIKALLAKIQKSFDECIIANKTGSFFKNAKGLSLYFPEFSIHKSYRNNVFAFTSEWLNILQLYFS